jgi:hypothetical protein
MKTFRLALAGLLIAITSLFAVSAKAADPSLTVSGVTLSWPAVIYQPTGTSPVTMNITNDSGRVLLYAKYFVKDKFGTEVADGPKINVPVGISSITANWYAYIIDNSTAPYTLTFFIEFYSSSGIANPAPVSTAFTFTSRSSVTATPAPVPTVTVTATPAPVPTVTVTATPAPAATIYVTNPADKDLSYLVTILNKQVSTLKAKLKKVCSVKPKPKRC